MEAQGRQTSGGGGGTETTGEGEDEESSSSSSNIDKLPNKEITLRSLLEDEIQNPPQENLQLDEGREKDENDSAISNVHETENGKNDDVGVKKETENVLEQFRQQWRSELQKSAAFGNSKTNTPRDQSPAWFKESSPRPVLVVVEEKPPRKKSDGDDIYETASRLFQNGIDCERQGKMHDAIRSYRQALLLVPDIEKRLLVSTTGGGASGGRTYAMVASESVEDKRRPCDSELPFSATTEELLEIFKHRLFITNGGKALCTPADKEDDGEEQENDEIQVESTHISQLPTEVLLQIFKWVVSSELDLRQLEQLSVVCCGFYIVSRDPELWRLACLKVWGVRLGILDSIYPSWRQMYVERPHLWYNGVYISKITYVRHGETAWQDQFYRPWHLVVYYRYLKFFADGTMLMLTTPDDPSSIVPGLKFNPPRLQGILKGTYRLVGQNCVAGVLSRKNSALMNNESTSSPYIRNRFVKQPNDLMEHVFSLVLNINSIKRRRHIQLTWSNYEVTARYRNGQTSTSKFDLCDQKFPPVYFSRVKGFTTNSEMPLK